MNNFIGKVINNPRKDNGDFGDHCCSNCGEYSSGYIVIDIPPYLSFCKGCLLHGVDLIDKVMMEDCLDKGKKRLMR